MKRITSIRSATWQLELNNTKTHVAPSVGWLMQRNNLHQQKMGCSLIRSNTVLKFLYYMNELQTVDRVSCKNDL